MGAQGKSGVPRGGRGGEARQKAPPEAQGHRVQAWLWLRRLVCPLAQEWALRLMSAGLGTGLGVRCAAAGKGGLGERGRLGT